MNRNMSDCGFTSNEWATFREDIIERARQGALPVCVRGQPIYANKHFALTALSSLCQDQILYVSDDKYAVNESRLKEVGIY